MPSAIRMVLALGAVAILGGLDATVGSRLIFAPLYAAPIAFAAWRAGLREGALVALGAGVARLASEVAWHGADLAAVWNGAAWTAVFVALAWFVAWGRMRREEVASLDARVGELIQIEHSLARTDPLTSLCNRRAFIDALQQAEARSRRSGGALAVARLDIDGFRGLNETYSRADGDQLLRAVATSLSLTTRMGDLAARLENDEFAILLYGCGPDDAQRVGQRLVTEVAELGRAYPEARITASMGVACFASPGPDPDEMMRLAGSALRRARLEGGNAVLVEREWTPGVAIHDS
jgi:diguanylate cyclase (GGDEF)-like protein